MERSELKRLIRSIIEEETVIEEAQITEKQNILNAIINWAKALGKDTSDYKKLYWVTDLMKAVEQKLLTIDDDDEKEITVTI